MHHACVGWACWFIARPLIPSHSFGCRLFELHEAPVCRFYLVFLKTESVQIKRQARVSAIVDNMTGIYDAYILYMTGILLIFRQNRTDSPLLKQSDDSDGEKVLLTNFPHTDQTTAPNSWFDTLLISNYNCQRLSSFVEWTNSACWSNWATTFEI